MISNKTLTQEDINKIIKETEEQIENEPVYKKKIENNEEWVVIGYNTKTKSLEKVQRIKNV
jgi:hypothetical protein